MSLPTPTSCLTSTATTPPAVLPPTSDIAHQRHEPQHFKFKLHTAFYHSQKWNWKTETFGADCKNAAQISAQLMPLKSWSKKIKRRFLQHIIAKAPNALYALVLWERKRLLRMSKASSVVASVTQQSRQRVPQSRTEYRERLKTTWVETARRADDQRRSVDDVTVPSPLHFSRLLLPLQWISS